MWTLKPTLLQRIKHVFGKHFPVQWYDSSMTCIICKKVLYDPHRRKVVAGEDLRKGQLVVIENGLAYKATGNSWTVGSCDVNEREATDD